MIPGGPWVCVTSDYSDGNFTAAAECEIVEDDVFEGTLRRSGGSQQHLGRFRHRGSKVDPLLQADSLGHSSIATCVKIPPPQKEARAS